MGSGMVVAQLAEWSPPTPVIRGSNPNIGKKYICQLYSEKKKIKKKSPGWANYY